MSDFLKYLKSLVGKEVRLHFYIGGNAAYIPDEESYLFCGTIEDVNGGILTFKHEEDEQIRIGIENSIINLECVSIWSIDIPLEEEKMKVMILDEDC